MGLQGQSTFQTSTRLKWFMRGRFLKPRRIEISSHSTRQDIFSEVSRACVVAVFSSSEARTIPVEGPSASPIQHLHDLLTLTVPSHPDSTVMDR